MNLINTETNNLSPDGAEYGYKITTYEDVTEIVYWEGVNKTPQITLNLSEGEDVIVLEKALQARKRFNNEQKLSNERI